MQAKGTVEKEGHLLLQSPPLLEALTLAGNGSIGQLI